MCKIAQGGQFSTFCCLWCFFLVIMNRYIGFQTIMSTLVSYVTRFNLISLNMQQWHQLIKTFSETTCGMWYIYSYSGLYALKELSLHFFFQIICYICLEETKFIFQLIVKNKRLCPTSGAWLQLFFF